MQGGQLGAFLPFIIIILVFYFLMIRPQQKRDKAMREMLEALKVGDNVTTIGGIYGKIVRIKDEVITIEVGPDKVKLVMARWSIRSVDNEEDDDDDEE
ncbi:MAG TPA: preprotein translocase subunit YajC [Clostridiales bacterium]|nr:preprotein translocase subunit YajC [Clostridiales bacterium]